MRIDGICISGHKMDLRFTRCCVASIRHYYPAIPISLIKDCLHGDYDTRDLEASFGVTLFDTPVKRFGWGMAKLEPMLLPQGRRFLVLDSDTVFTGRVLDLLERSEADFVVEECDHTPEDIRTNYFDPEVVALEYPDFRYPGWVFNSGHFVASSGLVSRPDFEPFVLFEEPRKVLRPERFTVGDQGFLNFVLFAKQQSGELTIDRCPFVQWAYSMEPGSVSAQDLMDGVSPCVIHWAGPKLRMLTAHPMGEVLRYFETAYYRRVHGR